MLLFILTCKLVLDSAATDIMHQSASEFAIFRQELKKFWEGTRALLFRLTPKPESETVYMS